MSRSPESQLKRARELALKEKRQRKEEKKAARDAARSAGPGAIQEGHEGAGAGDTA